MEYLKKTCDLEEDYRYELVQFYKGKRTARSSIPSQGTATSPTSRVGTFKVDRSPIASGAARQWLASGVFCPVLSLHPGNDIASVNKVILVVEPYMPRLPKPSDLAKLVTTMQENPHGTLALVSLTAMIVLAVVVVVR